MPVEFDISSLLTQSPLVAFCFYLLHQLNAEKAARLAAERDKNEILAKQLALFQRIALKVGEE